VFLGNALCFQHKNANVTTLYSKARRFDQFYTSEENSTLCLQLYSGFIPINKVEDLIIEPSAGAGSFVNGIRKLCNNNLFFDIDPILSCVQVVDFLKFNKPLNNFKKIHIIGNPPFNILKMFFKKACEIADVIGFILPLSFRKASRKNWVPLNFKNSYEHILHNSNFFFRGRIHRVPTVFQIWEKTPYLREPHVTITSHFIKFVKKNKNPTLSFKRVGDSNCGEISLSTQDKSANTH